MIIQHVSGYLKIQITKSENAGNILKVLNSVSEIHIKNDSIENRSIFFSSVFENSGIR